MDSNTQPQPVSQPRSPTELLNAQTQSLAQLVEIQKAQMAESRQQNERMQQLLGSQAPGQPAAGVAHVKIENINMPFGAMVGFLIKVALASIPAAIILTIIYGVVIAILAAVFGGFFSALSNSLGY